MPLLNYFTNLVRLLVRDRLLSPLAVAYCVTMHCNLNCVYCEDFGARRNPEQPAPLPLDDAQQLLAIIRRATGSLILTGGEPLLYPEIEALIRHAKHDLHFRHITLLSNAVLLPGHVALLPHIDRLMISVDATTPAKWDESLRAAPGTAQRILDNVIDIAARQRTDRFRLVVNCVITPETLPLAEQVLDFCKEHRLLFSFSPQSANNWPHYDLLVSDAYRDFAARLLHEKQQGAPILGSAVYLKRIADFAPYACYPMLIPRVLPHGELAFPCRPIEREGDEHGGPSIGLLEAGSWRAALRQAVAAYGLPPSTCGACYQQCYVEPSLMQAQPWALLAEYLTYPASRQGRLETYAPG
jgi:MoaA/NifB/PqqE/SkfB family radical SAM enzyme